MPVAVAIGFGALALVAFLYSLSYAYNYSIGAMLQAIVAGIKNLPRLNYHFGSINFDFLAAPFEAVDNAIRHAIGAGIIACESVWNYFFGYVSHLVIATGEAIAGVAEDAERKFAQLVAHDIPTSFKYRLAWLKAQVVSLEHRIGSTADTASKTAVGTVTKIEKVTVTKAAAVAGTISLPKIRAIDQAIDTLEGKTKSLYKKLTVAGIIGLIGATIFDQFGLSWLRCRGVGRVGRKLCGLSAVIEALAIDALDVLLISNLCEMVTVMTKGADFAAPAISRIVGMTDHLISCQGASRPKALAVASYAAPPSEDLVSFAA